MHTLIQCLSQSRSNRLYLRRFQRSLIIVGLGLWLNRLHADVPTGSLSSAKKYYKSLSEKLNYSTPDKISQTTLTDLAAYLGYRNLTLTNLEYEDPEVLMGLGADRADVLASRFFAPKIMNVKFKEGDKDFRLGWRKLVRLRSQVGSPAKSNSIVAAVILFNTFTSPGAIPFARSNESVNTQVMLLPDPDKIRRPPPQKDNDATMDSAYWLDYQNLSSGGRLGYALNASFDANELSGVGNKDYFVPEGCVACHGLNPQRPLLNFLDTDHWFDRLENDFQKLKDSGLALLFDAGTNDPDSPKYRQAFDIIAKFNLEADKHAKQAQPFHDETLASAKWQELHSTNFAHLPPIQRAIGPSPQWNKNEKNVLNTMNQYCYRCHGTVKFSVFNRTNTFNRRALIVGSLAVNAKVGIKMPPDRDLPDDKREQLVNFFKSFSK